MILPILFTINFLVFCMFSNCEAVPHIVVSKQEAFIDEPISISVEDLKPFQLIELKASTTDVANEPWSSFAKFKANQEGIVSLNEDIPFEGSYDFANGMGLIWSMKPIASEVSSFALSLEPIQITLQLLIDDKIVNSIVIQRNWLLPNVQKIIVREQGIVGTLFIPQTQEPAPVIITFNGSDGGVNENRAALLASHGFAVFTLAYFGIEPLPATLENIEIEYIEKAFAWIKKRSDLDGSRIGIWGGSKGGELVLILGTLFPESIQAIVGVIPSCAVYPGCAEGNPLPAWRYKGALLEPIAYMMPVEPEAGVNRDDPIWLTPYFFKGIEQKPELFRDAAIKVEKIQCPILLVSGGDDQMWPSGFYSEKVKKRCDQANVPCTHLYYPKAGHQIRIPYLPAPGLTSWHPVTKRWYFMGGTTKDNELAKQDFWPKMLKFFEDTLKNTK